jgi:hypothetical protein
MNLFTKLMVGAIIIAPVGLTRTASASTSYTDAVSFTAAAGTITTVDFGTCGAGSSSVNFTTLAGSGLCSGLPSGIDFTPTTGGSLFVAPPGVAGNPTVALGLNEPKGGVISFTLGSLATSFAANFFQNFGFGLQDSEDTSSFTISFYKDDALNESSTFDVAPEGIYFGLTGLSLFNRVTIAQPTGYATIDDVSFGGSAGVVTAAPEPATWAMMLIGFGAAGLAMRRAPRRAGATTKA